MSDLRSELLAIREEHGKLTPAAIVKAATAEEHPLHGRFEWDDAVAGHKYRLVQARELIRVVKQTYVNAKGDPERVRVFVSIPEPTGMVYKPADEVIGDEFARKLILQQMEREWRQLRRRYDRFSEFTEIVLRDIQPDAA